MIWRRLWAASIWHPDAIPAIEGQSSRELKRYVLPTFDFIIVLMGIAGVVLGMPSFDIVYDADTAHLSGWLLLAGGVLALVGVSFPRLRALEGAGKILMLYVIGGYAAALWVLTFLGEGQRWIVALALTALLVLPMWNLARLGRERRNRPRRRKRAT
ncbi:hypothetical protein [Microbacterium aurantiacum]|uniref:hypothetical protein n=1 Tax=Microbacterium aurantiacum TaxID=162393 RepID=UPI00344AB5E2